MVRFPIVKNAARIILFYAIAFLFFLLIGTGVSTMRAWMEGAFGIPSRSISLYSTILYYLGASLPSAVFGAALLALPGGGHRGRGPALTGIVVFILSAGSLIGVTYATAVLRRSTVPSSREANMRVLGEEGLIVDYSEAALVYLEEPGKGLGNAVVSGEGAPLRTMRSGEAQALVKRMRERSPFGPSLETPATIIALERAFTGIAHRLSLAAKEDVFSLLCYACALALLLASFSPFAGMTSWPLADLVLCAIFYRGVLELDGFVASGPVIRFVSSLRIGIPDGYLVPALLGAVGVFIALAGLLVRVIRGKKDMIDA